MTEAEWLACANHGEMLAFLRGRGSERKLRLFACACARRVWHLLTDEQIHEVVEVAEKFAEGLMVRDNLLAAAEVARVIYAASTHGTAAVASIGTSITLADAIAAARETATNTRYAEANRGSFGKKNIRAAARQLQCELLRDIFGNPFCPSLPLSPAVLAWNDATVRRIAEAIYAERAFSRMPILHDALLDAGCTDEALLMHCRNPEGHVLGCWALDSVLGKS
jgi:hypothetical protein